MVGKRSSRCPECGAREGSCKALLEEFLAREFEDPAYGAVHHLTVATYMLQHSSQLTREGWVHERELLRDFLVNNKPPATVTRQIRNRTDGGRRTFKIRSRDGLALFPRVRWGKTILDVRPENPDEYRQDVVAWAKATLADCETLNI